MTGYRIWRVRFLEAVGTSYCFTAGAFGSKLEYLAGAADLPRLLIPVFAAMAVFWFRDSRKGAGDRTYATAFLDMTLAGAAVILSQLILEQLRPDWVLHWAPTQGGFVGWIFVTAVRSIFTGESPVLESATDAPRRPEEMAWKFSDLRERVRWQSGASVGIGLALIVVFGWIAGHATALHVRIGAGGFVLLGVLAALSFLAARRPAGAGANIEAYTEELARQYRVRAQWWVGLATLAVPSGVVFLYGTHVYEFVAVIYLLLFAELALRSAEQCRSELLQTRNMQAGA